MEHRRELDEVLLNFQTGLNQLIALSDEAENLLKFNKTLLKFEIKANNLRTAYGFGKIIIWKTIEHDFYLYVYNQLSSWFRSTYENDPSDEVKRQLEGLLRRLKSTMNQCLGLDLPAVIQLYRDVLNDCKGCKNGLDSLVFDEATIETQTLQLLEQMATELGYDIRLYDRLNELSDEGSLDHLSRDLTSGSSTASREATKLKLTHPVTTKMAVFSAPHNMTSTIDTIQKQTVAETTSGNANKPISSVGRLAGPVGPGWYPPTRDLQTSVPVANSARLVGDHPMPSKNSAKVELQNILPPIPTGLPQLGSQNGSFTEDFRESSRPFGYYANAAYFREQDRLSKLEQVSKHVTEPPVKQLEQQKPTAQSLPAVQSRDSTHDQPLTVPPKETPAKIFAEQSRLLKLNTEFDYRRSPQSPSPVDSTGFFYKVQQRECQGDDQPFKTQQQPASLSTDAESESDDRAKIESTVDAISTTFTDLRFGNRNVTDGFSTSAPIYTSLTSGPDQQTEEEYQYRQIDQEKRRQWIEKVDFDKADKTVSNSSFSRTDQKSKMPMQYDSVIPIGKPDDRKFSYVFQRGNEQIHMSSAPSPFQMKLFSPEQSIEISSDSSSSPPPPPPPPPEKQPSFPMSSSSESSSSVEITPIGRSGYSSNPTRGQVVRSLSVGSHSRDSSCYSSTGSCCSKSSRSSIIGDSSEPIIVGHQIPYTSKPVKHDVLDRVDPHKHRLKKTRGRKSASPCCHYVPSCCQQTCCYSDHFQGCHQHGDVCRSTATCRQACKLCRRKTKNGKAILRRYSFNEFPHSGSEFPSTLTREKPQQRSQSQLRQKTNMKDANKSIKCQKKKKDKVLNELDRTIRAVEARYPSKTQQKISASLMIHGDGQCPPEKKMLCKCHHLSARQIGIDDTGTAKLLTAEMKDKADKARLKVYKCHQCRFSHGSGETTIQMIALKTLPISLIRMNKND